VEWSMNLQLFAQERTEKPTPRRRQKARERGQVVASRELNSVIVLFTALFVLKIFGPAIIDRQLEFIKMILRDYIQANALSGVTFTHNILVDSMLFLSRAILPIVAGVFLAGIVSNFLQVGFVFSLKPIYPDLNRINPLQGIKRIFSRRSLMELIKSILKIFIVAYVTFSVIKSRINTFPLMLDMSMEDSAKFLTNTAFDIGFKSALALLVLAVFDYIFNRREHEKSLMMSKQDIKEEYKEMEGNPQTKTRIRQIQRQISRRRMMHDIKNADVVITNPTHIAVALMYDADTTLAPILIAKGRDKLAQKIKDIAEIEGVPIVENKSLARVIYKSVDIGEAIPEKLYNAVAEILAFVYSMKERGY
jgi:flagellar biosynthetic protein FlhB